MERLHTHQLDIRSAIDPGGVVRVAVFGELDLATGDSLETRLRQLGEEGRAVVLDLSALAFIDASGLRAVIHSVADASREGRRLEVDRRISRSLAKLLTLTGTAGYVWPAGAAGREIDGLDPARGAYRPLAHCTGWPDRRMRASSGRPLRGWRPPIRPRN
jgi:anti-anti-sigma factor